MSARRAFMTTMAGAVLSLSLGASAQSPTKRARVGWLSGRPGGRPASRAALIEGLKATEVAAKTAGLTLVALTISSADQIEGRVAEAARQRVAALLALTSPLVTRGIERLADAALKHRLPAICPFAPLFPEAGGLIAYGPNFEELFRRAGGYAARILKGAKVGELPVQRPEKFDLAINLKTARALGLTLPVLLVQRADRVIE
jgi:putative ABC transport system substrate-binding protein